MARLSFSGCECFRDASIYRTIGTVSTKTADQIKVEYRFVAHPTTNNTIHVAMIPLGKLPLGEVQVVVEQVASVDMDGNEQPPIRRLERRVSGPFILEVVK